MVCTTWCQGCYPDAIFYSFFRDWSFGKISYSLSESKKNGGKIGWVYKSQLSNKISEQVGNIKVGEFTEPITVPGGFIILKLVDKKNQLLEINEEEEFKKAVNFETNRQLTMYSTLHYKRVYNRAVINEF